MLDRKKTGRISEGRKIFRRSGDSVDAELPDLDEVEATEEASGQEAPEGQAHELKTIRLHRDEIPAVLKALDLADYNISEVTAVEKFQVDGQTIIQLKTGEFVKIALIAPDEETPAD